MIQRKQTLYLLLTVILMVIVCLAPLATFWDGTGIFTFYSYGIRSATDSQLVEQEPYMGFLAAFTTLLPLVIIFLYKRRLLQIRLCFAELVLLIGIQAYIGMHLWQVWNVIGDEPNRKLIFSLVDILPIPGIILTWLAIKGITKDEALVRSLNRIR